MTAEVVNPTANDTAYAGRVEPHGCFVSEQDSQNNFCAPRISTAVMARAHAGEADAQEAVCQLVEEDLAARGRKPAVHVVWGNIVWVNGTS